MNVGMVVLHWLFSPGVYLWIENMPIPDSSKSAVDKNKPASDSDTPVTKTDKAEVT